MRILLVEDDQLIGDGLKTGLEKMGFAVDWFQNGTEGCEALLLIPYDAVVLDLGLPDRDGLSVLKEWRQKGHKEPVLILTAKGDVDNRIIGLDSGADDYLPKPFALREVIARLKALIRRRNDQLEPLVQCQDISFNPNTKEVFKNNIPVELAPKEIFVLELLLSRRNQVFSRELLEEKLYTFGNEVQSNAVEVHIHHLRKKLGKDLIKTVPKIGYMIQS